ncbi:MAG: alpha amylase C-terminal domain-containing protein [Nitrospira sp.]|jgi:1,4-alpha-glucan branching enzyme|nr:alpha-amylase family glycosyl hydrolase [Nitrospira sp. BO4]
MAASQLNITSNTPLGATLVPGGATFRTWAPTALEVYIALGHLTGTAPGAFPKNPGDLLVKDAHGYWAGFVPGIKDGDLYRFYVVGTGSEGFKRDPYARELECNGYPDCNCIVRDPADYPWHDRAFRPPGFNDLIIYQFHIGVFYATDAAGNDLRPHRICKILDVVDRIEYFADLGVNAVMPLPFQEYQGENSLGYNGTDLFSPEMDYAVPAADLAPYLGRVNRLLAAKGCDPLSSAQLTGQINQFKAFIDLCHLYGIAVLADVVYNHAGGGFDDQSIKFFDRQPETTDNNSLYFTDQDHAGGRVFAFWKREVRQFLIDNGKFLLQEYHVDGLRYDQVTVIAESGGWYFAQDLTNTLRFMKPTAAQIAEYWGGERWKGVAVPPYGMGFDIGYSDMLRDSLRAVIDESTGGRDAYINLNPLRDALYLTHKDPGRWTVFQCIENHDLLYYDHQGRDRQPRIAALADPTNTRSWYARSRSKVATGLLLTAPGVPMIFMGQEFLEDKYWTDWPGRPELLIWWAGLEGQDKHMSDHHRFTRDLLWLRRKHPALRGEGINVFHMHNENRVIAMHRWLPGIGRDVVVVASLNEHTFYNYSYHIGFPGGGHWNEVFNSDVYDQWFNPNAQGNPGGVSANGPAWDGMPTSGGITLPANSLLVFARDGGDF